MAFNHERLFAWKALLRRIVRECRLLRGDSSPAAEEKFRECFKLFLKDTGGEQFIPFLPVLNELLGTAFTSDNTVVQRIIPDRQRIGSFDDLDGPEEEKSLNSYFDSKGGPHDLTPKDRKELLLKHRVDIIIHLLKQVSRYSTMVILISKFQYMDLDDWAITDTVARKIKFNDLTDVSLVLTGWSMDTKALTYNISPEERQVQEHFQKIKKLCWLECVLPKWSKQVWTVQ